MQFYRLITSHVCSLSVALTHPEPYIPNPGRKCRPGTSMRAESRTWASRTWQRALEFLVKGLGLLEILGFKRWYRVKTFLSVGINS